MHVRYHSLIVCLLQDRYYHVGPGKEGVVLDTLGEKGGWVRRSSEAGERDLQAKADRVMDTGESVQALTQVRPIMRNMAGR